MSTYVLPQTLVFQETAATPAAAARPLRAHISGGNAFLIRYAETTERDLGYLGYYDRLVAEDYAWPNRPVGAKVDAGYVKVWMKDALLQYFTDTIGSGSTIVKVPGYNNQVRSTSINFATNGAYSRHSSLLSRDVQPGDIVKVRAIDEDTNPVTLWTYVKSLIGDEVAAVVGAATADDANPDTQISDVTVDKTAGPDNCMTLAADVTDYNGLPSGRINETYRVIVLEGSSGGDLTTARLRIISGDGTDSEASVTPDEAGVEFSVGSRGLKLTFDFADSAACSESADNDAVSPDDLIAGQEWLVTVEQAFTKPVATSSGDYDGTQDTTYIVEVVTGGLWAASPKIRVTTTNGIDLSGPTTVSAAATPVAVGTKGVLVAFSGNGLRYGDRYYIECTGVAVGAMKTIQLGHNLPTTVPDSSEVDVTLYIRKPLLQISQNREDSPPDLNWETSDTEITINSGLTAYDDDWNDNGVPVALDVYSASEKGYGKLYVEYRAWLPTLSFGVTGLFDVSELDAIPGPLTPDNPLKWGMFKALSNSNGTEVKCTAVADPDDVESWVDVLELLLGRDDVVNLVPLTRNRDVLDLYAAHVDAMSSAEQGLWRVLWTNLAGIPEIPVVHAGSTVPGYTEATTTDGETCLCVIEGDPGEYTTVRCPAGNGQFVTNGVRPGDTVRALYVSDGFGNFEWSEYLVDLVDSEDELRVVGGPLTAQSVPAKIEIWRTLSATEESVAISAVAGSWSNPNVRAVWPDQIESSGTIQEGYFLCAALAGLRSGVLPHQGLTNLEIAGFTDVSRTTRKFNRTQLNTMAVNGVWIVSQELSPTSSDLGKVYTRHAVTTGDYDDIHAREEMNVSNLISIKYRFKELFAPFIGVTNVTPSMQAVLRAEAGYLLNLLATELATPRLGGQIVSGTIVSLQPDPVFRDRYVLEVSLVDPKTLNNMVVRIVVT